MSKSIYESVFVNLLEYIVENGYTPHLVIDLSIQGVTVPAYLGTKGALVLNISSTSCISLSYDDLGIAIRTSFNRVLTDVFLPWNSIRSVFAKECEGVVFLFGGIFGAFRPPNTAAPVPPKKGKPKLTLVKG